MTIIRADHFLRLLFRFNENCPTHCEKYFGCAWAENYFTTTVKKWNCCQMMMGQREDFPDSSLVLGTRGRISHPEIVMDATVAWCGIS